MNTTDATAYSTVPRVRTAAARLAAVIGDERNFLSDMREDGMDTRAQYALIRSLESLFERAIAGAPITENDWLELY